MKYICIGAHPDAAVECDSLYDEKCRILDCHVSQFYEWLPWSQGRRDFAASNMTWEQKREHLGHWLERFRIAADGARDVLVETYGDDGRTVRYSETFELTQFGRQVSVSDFRRLMAGLEPQSDEVVQLD